MSIIEPIFDIDSISSLPSIDHNCLNRSVHTCLFVSLNSKQEKTKKKSKDCIHLVYESESTVALQVIMFEKLESKLKIFH